MVVYFCQCAGTTGVFFGISPNESVLPWNVHALSTRIAGIVSSEYKYQGQDGCKRDVKRRLPNNTCHQWHGDGQAALLNPHSFIHFIIVRIAMLSGAWWWGVSIKFY
jgi:hypothetical protein